MIVYFCLAWIRVNCSEWPFTVALCPWPSVHTSTVFHLWLVIHVLTLTQASASPDLTLGAEKELTSEDPVQGWADSFVSQIRKQEILRMSCMLLQRSTAIKTLSKSLQLMMIQDLKWCIVRNGIKQAGDLEKKERDYELLVQVLTIDLRVYRIFL